MNTISALPTYGKGLADGAPLYIKIKEQEARLGGIEFTYWIEDQLREYLSETEE